MIKAYSLIKDGKTYIAKNFQIKEFACSDGSDTIFIDDRLPIYLQALRSHFGNKLHILSGYRTEAKNDSTEGASEFSQHMYGMAADFWIENTTPKEIYNFADKILLNGGLGLYEWGVHLDTREQKARW